MEIVRYFTDHTFLAGGVPALNQSQMGVAAIMVGRHGALMSFLLFCGLMSGCGSAPEKAEKPKYVPPKPGQADKDAPTEFSVTKSGLKYKILRKSDGRKATDADMVKINFREWLDDETIVRTTYGTGGTPAQFEMKYNNHGSGWAEGLQLIGEGGMIELEIPPELAYGKQGFVGIPANSTIHALIEVISVTDAPPPPALMSPTAKAAESEPAKVDADAPMEFTTTPSGLKYRIRRKSDGQKPTASNGVKVHYRGWLDNGKEFDSSYGRGEPAKFQLNEVIKGWTEGLQLIGVGGMIELEIPPDLAYGSQNKPGIPPNSTLHFVVELLDMR